MQVDQINVVSEKSGIEDVSQAEIISGIRKCGDVDSEIQPAGLLEDITFCFVVLMFERLSCKHLVYLPNHTIPSIHSLLLSPRFH